MSDRTTVLVANPSPDVYGSDLQMLESISAMTDRGWRVVVAIPSDGELVPRIRERGAEVIMVHFPVLRRANASLRSFVSMVGDALWSMPRLLRLMRRLNVDVVYVNTVTLPWWLLATKIARVPSVCHLHEAETQDKAAIRKALILPLRLATAVIVISKSALGAMSESDPSLTRKARLIYNGVPRPPQTPVRPARKLPFHAVVVGRLSPRKAPHLALAAVGLLRQRGHDVTVELAGTAFEGYEWYVSELESRAEEKDLRGSVTFSGYCSPIWPALARADIVVAPSLREPFGNAVVEAQLSLRPVVATAALGHLESIVDEESGLLVPPEDVEAMAAAILRLLEDEPLASRLADNAAERADRLFSTDRYSREICDLLLDVTQRKSAR